MDEMTLTLNSPITEEQWDAITDVDFEHTNEITFHTKHGKEVKFVKASAQPEIIHCKDCKNSEHWYRDRRRCFLWSENGVSVFDDGFCNYAKRREE